MSVKTRTPRTVPQQSLAKREAVLYSAIAKVGKHIGASANFIDVTQQLAKHYIEDATVTKIFGIPQATPENLLADVKDAFDPNGEESAVAMLKSINDAQAAGASYDSDEIAAGAPDMLDVLAGCDYFLDDDDIDE